MGRDKWDPQWGHGPDVGGERGTYLDWVTLAGLAVFEAHRDGWTFDDPGWGRRIVAFRDFLSFSDHVENVMVIFTRGGGNLMGVSLDLDRLVEEAVSIGGAREVNLAKIKQMREKKESVVARILFTDGEPSLDLIDYSIGPKVKQLRRREEKMIVAPIGFLPGEPEYSWTDDTLFEGRIGVEVFADKVTLSFFDPVSCRTHIHREVGRTLVKPGRFDGLPWGKMPTGRELGLLENDIFINLR